MTKHLIEIEAILKANTSQFRQQLDRDLAGFQGTVASKAAATSRPGVSATNQLATQQGRVEAQVRREHQLGNIGDERLTMLLREIESYFARMAQRLSTATQTVNPPSRSAVDYEAQRQASVVEREARAAEERRARQRDEDDYRNRQGPGPTSATNERFRRDVTPRTPGDFTTAPAYERIQLTGEEAALKRLFGLAVGVAQLLEESEEPLAAGLRTLRANLTALQQYQAVTERAAEQQALYNSLTGESNRDLAAATSRLALVREKRALAEADAKRDGTAPLIDDQGRGRATDRIRRAEIELAELESLRDPGSRSTLGSLQASRQELADANRAEASRLRREGTRLEAAATAENEAFLTRRSINEQRTRDFIANGGMNEGTWWQQRQASIASRQGGPPRSPLDFQTGRQFLESKAITTAGFALSGGLLYGALSLGGDIFRESTELQQELAIIRTQFDSLDQTVNSITFDDFRRQIQATAVDTGVAANEVANVQRQLAGAFADREGNPNFDLAASEGRIALQYSKVSGLPQQEITDSLTAVSLAFRTVTEDGREIPLEFSQILDTITDLENRFGVLGPEILKFTADLAPLGKELGLTAEQLAGLGAVAQQASGKSGAVLAEQLGRILPSFAEKADELGALLASNERTQGQAAALAVAAQTGDTSEALKILIGAYGDLDDAQKRQLATLVGGRREAATFYALLDRGNQTLKVLGEESDTASGSFSKRWDEYRKTVVYAFEQVRRSVEEFGQQLFEAGIADALVGAADAAKIFLGAASGLLTVIRELNDLLGGLPGRALGVYAAFKGLAAIWKLAGGAGALGGMAASVRANGVGGSIAGLFSPTVTAQGAYGTTGEFLRPSVARAAQSPTFSRFLTRDATGAISAGVGTSLTAGAFSLGSVLGPLAVTMAVSYGVSEYMKLRGELEEAKKTDRESIRSMLDRGVSADAIEQAINDAADGSRDDGWRGDLLGAFRINQTDARMETLVEELRRDELSPLTAGLEELLRSDQTGRANVLDNLQKSLQENFGRGAYGEDPEVQRKLTEIFGSGEEVTGFDAGGAVITTNFRVTEKRMQTLLEQIRKNPTDQTLIDTANFLLSLPGADEYREDINNAILAAQVKSDDAKALTDLVEGRGKKAEEGRAEYEARLKNRQSAAASGRASIQPILQVIREQIAVYTELRDDAIAIGTDSALEVAANYATQIDELNKLAAGTVAGDADAISVYRDRVNQAVGRTQLEASLRNLAASAEAYKRKSAAPETTPLDRGNSALDVIERQRELFEARIAGAGVDDIDAIIAQSGQIDPGMRQDVIAGSLSSGPNAEVIEKFTSIYGQDAEDVKNLLAAAFAQNRDLEKTALVANAKARLDVLNLIGADPAHAKNGSDPWTEEEWNAYFDEYNRLSSFIDALPDLNNLDIEDPGPTLDDDLARKTARLNDLELDKSRLRSSDAIGRARNELEQAQTRFDMTDPGTEERHDAEIALNEAQTAYDDALLSDARAIRQASADLAKARAAGDSIAQAAIELDLARAQLAEAGTPLEKLQAQAAIQNALNSQQDAVNRRNQQRGDYEAALLQGDTIGQARQQVDNARAALASARPDERYGALSALLDAQRNLQTAILDAFIAQKDLAIAVAEGMGDTVQVALLQLQQAQARLNAAREAGLKGAQLDAAKAEVVRAQNNLVSTQRNDRLGDLAYLYEFDKITAQAYIAALRLELSKIPESNKEARREIERRIKSLRDEMSSDLNFNIPNEIRIPTLYEARRLNETASRGPAGTTYQDNRTQQVIITDARDPDAVAKRVADIMNAPPRTSPTSSLDFVTTF